MQRMLLPALLSFALIVPSTLPASPPPHRAAPDFMLPTASGNLSLSQLRGKVVLIDFWASWCGPCRESFPWMAGMAEKYGGQGLVIVAINLDKTHDAAAAFLEKYPAPFTVAFDPYGKTADAFDVAVMPSSFIVSRSGKILYAHAGFETSKTGAVEEQIREALSK